MKKAAIILTVALLAVPIILLVGCGGTNTTKTTTSSPISVAGTTYRFIDRAMFLIFSQNSVKFTGDVTGSSRVYLDELIFKHFWAVILLALVALGIIYAANYRGVRGKLRGGSGVAVIAVCFFLLAGSTVWMVYDLKPKTSENTMESTPASSPTESQTATQPQSEPASQPVTTPAPSVETSQPQEEETEADAGSKESPWSYDSAQTTPYGVPIPYHGDSAWNVNDVGRVQTLQTPLGAETPSGIFVTMRITVWNHSSEEQEIQGLEREIELYDNAGRKYTVSDKAAYLENGYKYETIPPGTNVDRIAVFDTAPDAVGLVLRVHGWGYSDSEVLYIAMPI